MNLSITTDLAVGSEQGTTSLKAPYNTILIDQCRHLGGRWNDEEKVWVFPDFVADEVEELNQTFNSFPITIEITANREICESKKGIDFLGRPLCRAYDRDSGARIDADIAVISGYATSGGSRKTGKPFLLKERYLDFKFHQCFLNVLKMIDLTSK
ncbi:hypothetical protein [Vibrio sp. HN007]|uniref:hypothetical protein n=1 Tax=Vibrio iocasae TaxID=3098914 RepID=UPI0035D4CF32